MFRYDVRDPDVVKLLVVKTSMPFQGVNGCSVEGLRGLALIQALQLTREEDDHHDHEQRRPRSIQLHTIPVWQSCTPLAHLSKYTEMTAELKADIPRRSTPCTFNP